MTYSIVARDPETGDLGVAVQTGTFGVGLSVPWAEAGVGAIATQSFTEQSYGHFGLELMKAGRSPDEALAGLAASGPDERIRQVGMVDAEGRAAAHTGAGCIRECGHLLGDGYAVQANMMAQDGLVCDGDPIRGRDGDARPRAPRGARVGRGGGRRLPRAPVGGTSRRPGGADRLPVEGVPLEPARRRSS